MGVWSRGAEEGNHSRITSEGLCVSVKLLSLRNRYIDLLTLSASVRASCLGLPCRTPHPLRAKSHLWAGLWQFMNWSTERCSCPDSLPCFLCTAGSHSFLTFSILSFKLATFWLVFHQVAEEAHLRIACLTTWYVAAAPGTLMNGNWNKSGNRRGKLTHYVLNLSNTLLFLPFLKLPVDLGHVTGLVVALCDWVFQPHLVRSGFPPHVEGAVLLPCSPLYLTTQRLVLTMGKCYG